MVQTMTAYENYEFNMALVEELFRPHRQDSAFGRTEFTVRGHVIDFAKPWRRVSMNDAVREATGVDFLACAATRRRRTPATRARIGAGEAQPTVGEALVRAFERAVEPTLIQPTLVFGHPVEISPLG